MPVKEIKTAGNLPDVDSDFFIKQTRRLLSVCDQVDHDKIDSYMITGGYNGLKKALSMGPDEVVGEVKKAGLRGRGGGGFSTADKWEVCRQECNSEKYIICNCDEGGPGTYMSRFLIGANPHAVIEGLSIAAYAIGASVGYVFIRPDYNDALDSLEQAITVANEKNCLGSCVMGTNFNFELEIRLSPGEFICGEETALIACIEGKRAMPSAKPPHPAVKGLWGKPTIINNAETLANISLVMARGSGWFKEVGTEKSPGTKIFAVTGSVKYPGLVEAPIGVSMEYLIKDICGGPEKKTRKLKAVQVGGPTGGVIPASLFDTPLDYDSLRDMGVMMGPGSIVAMDKSTCMVEMARYFLAFSEEESCGKCTPCRIGLKRIREILTRITEGKGREGDISLLVELGEDVSLSSLCGLGRTAPNAVLSSIRYFRDEYEDHIHNNRCSTAGCVSLRKYTVIGEKCKKCGTCYRACPADAITWQKKEQAVIDKDKCVKCGSCYDACPFGSIE
jgi:NADH-quinone oxidoreductase subunit F